VHQRIARYYDDIGQPLAVGEDGMIDVRNIALDDAMFKVSYGTAGRGKAFSEEADRCILLTIYK
jgi:hypothetical protein